MPIVVRHDVPGSLMGALAYRAGRMGGEAQRRQQWEAMQFRGAELGLRRYLQELSLREGMKRRQFAEAEQWRRMEAGPRLATEKLQGAYDWKAGKIREVLERGDFDEPQFNAAMAELDRQYGIRAPERELDVDYMVDPETGRRMQRPVGAALGEPFTPVAGMGAPPEAEMPEKPPETVQVGPVHGFWTVNPQTGEQKFNKIYEEKEEKAELPRVVEIMQGTASSQEIMVGGKKGTFDSFNPEEQAAWAERRAYAEDIARLGKPLADLRRQQQAYLKRQALQAPAAPQGIAESDEYTERMKAAARAGSEIAIEWCRERGIDYE